MEPIIRFSVFLYKRNFGDAACFKAFTDEFFYLFNQFIKLRAVDDVCFGVDNTVLKTALYGLIRADDAVSPSRLLSCFVTHASINKPFKNAVIRGFLDHLLKMAAS
ncbi:hypothetical protein OK016_17925 [Vibrio chagasii]|nr:hypothetical protein [Vibrio chagasii]